MSVTYIAGKNLSSGRKLSKFFLFSNIGQSYSSSCILGSGATSVLSCRQQYRSNKKQIVRSVYSICNWCKNKHSCQYGPKQNTRSLHTQYTWLANAIGSKATAPSDVPVAKSGSLKRVGRKKSAIEDNDLIFDRTVVSYTVGEEIDLQALREELLAKRVYSIVQLPKDITDGLMITANYKINDTARDAFIFSDGSVACWHMSESERNDMWQLARSFSSQPYESRSVLTESDSLPVMYDSETRLRGNVVRLKMPPEGTLHLDEKHVLDKYTFSNALSQSVKLSMKEAILEQLIEQLEQETLKLKGGVKSSLKNKDVTKMLGEVFFLRHVINLESGYLEYPDTYWERETQEELYREMTRYLNLPTRTKVFNERLNYCSEILNLINSQLNDSHHVRLEWIIIALILIEVIFEIVHYVEKYMHTQTVEASEDTSEDQP